MWHLLCFLRVAGNGIYEYKYHGFEQDSCKKLTTSTHIDTTHILAIRYCPRMVKQVKSQKDAYKSVCEDLLKFQETACNVNVPSDAWHWNCIFVFTYMYDLFFLQCFQTKRKNRKKSSNSSLSDAQKGHWRCQRQRQRRSLQQPSLQHCGS